MNMNKKVSVGPLATLASGAIFIVLMLLQPAAVKAQWTTDGSGNISNTNTGNVGIGTPSPTALLEVKKSQNAGTLIIVDNPFTTSPNTAFSGIFLKQGGANRLFVGSINDNNNIQAGGPGAVQFWNFANGPILFSTNNAEAMRLTGGGSLGIGTSSPDAKLHVHHSSSNTNLANIQLTDLAFALRNTSNTNGNMSLISFQDSTGYGNAQIGAIQSDHTNHRAHIVFLTRDGLSSFGERMRITGAGNVGIGTSAPTEKLEVTGNVKVSGTVEGGNIKAKYQDVAEWVESSQELQAGTVVVLDSTKSNQVVASTGAYDSRVAGVISLQPGIALGEQAEGRVLVATTGRVKVKVDASNGPINIGDLLVTSDKPGLAMKSIPVDIGGVRIHRPGTLIGKALEPLTGGTGEILVLLSMQ